MNRVPRLEKTCPTCRPSYLVREKRQNRYCSRRCFWRRSLGHFILCVRGGVRVFSYACLKKKYCSSTCFLAALHQQNKKPRHPRICAECQSVFLPRQPALRKRFCSRRCHMHNLHHKQGGEHHWNWRAGRSKAISKDSNNPLAIAWRQAIYRRDGWQCVICRVHCRQKNIVAHHRLGYTDYPDQRYILDNGMTLCRACHLWAHRPIKIAC